MVQRIRDYCNSDSDSDFNLDEELEDPRPRKGKQGQEIRDPNDEPDNERQNLEVQSEACTTTTGDHHRHRHLRNSVNIGLEIMGDGEYVVKIKRRRSSTGGSSSTHDEEGDEVEKAKQMAQNAASHVDTSWRVASGHGNETSCPDSSIASLYLENACTCTSLRFPI